MKDFDELLKTLEQPKEGTPSQEGRIKILFIDDDESMRRGLSRALSHKYEVLTAESGKKGLEVLTRDIYCVVLDVKMREMNGFSTYPKLKEKSPGVPIIFYTAFQSEHDLQEVINKYKPEGYVEKGKDIIYLEHLVENAVGKYKLILENEEYQRDLEEKVEERTMELRKTNAELEDTLKELQHTQAELIQQGTLASAGRLAIGVAHNIRNPIESVRRNLEALYPKSREVISAYVQEMAEEMTSEERKRLSAIIDDKFFSGNINLLDTLQANERMSNLEKIINGLQIERHELKKLAVYNITAQDFSNLKPYLLNYDTKRILSLLEIGYRFGVYISKSLESIKVANDIINATMSYAGIKEKEVATNINTNIENILTLMSGQLKKYNIQIKKDLDTSLPTIGVNQALFNQIYENLFSNAIYAMKEVRRDRELGIKTYQDEKNIYLQVIDNGTGFPKEMKGKLFQPFSTTKPQSEGIGIGLWTVYKIVNNFGSINIVSEPGKTLVTIRMEKNKVKTQDLIMNASNQVLK